MIRVLIADDHALIREGLSRVFSREPDMEVVAEAADAREAVERTLALDVDVVILDVNMPGTSGMEALERILAGKPGQAVLMLSMLAEENYAVRLLRAGAAGFASKANAAEEIVAAVRQVAAGHKYLSATAADSLAESLSRPPGTERHSLLSNREFQVLRLIAGGRGTRAIADELALSVNTVATYRRRILQKLELGSDVEITRYAIEHDLIE